MKSRQVALNIAANFLSVAVSLFVSFFLTPYIVESIGKEAYAFVPLSNNFVQYMSIFTVSMSAMTSRFVTIKLHQNDVDSASKYYSAAFYTNILLAVISTIICVFLVIYIDRLIDVPGNILTDVRYLFIFIFIGFILGVSTNVFSVASFSTNRLDVNSAINISGTITRVLVIIVCFSLASPRVSFIGLSVMLTLLVQDILHFISAIKLIPQVKIKWHYFRWDYAKEIFISGFWNSFSQLSSVLLTGLDLLIANVMLGASAAGILAVAKTAPLALQVLINVVPTAFNPHLTILFAKESREAFLSELLYTLKITAVLTGIPIAGFIALAPAFFRLWVPSVAGSDLNLLAILTMGQMIAGFGLMPLFYVFTITNKLKWASFSVFITGSLNLLLVIVLLKTTDLGLFAIAGVSSVLEVLRYLVFVPMYASHCLNTKPSTVYPSIIKSLVYMALLIASFLVLHRFLPSSSWLTLGASAMAMAVFGLGIGFVFMLNSSERHRIRTFKPFARFFKKKEVE
jgi:O-antigen/teichoic acid export membrane protein